MSLNDTPSANRLHIGFWPAKRGKIERCKRRYRAGFSGRVRTTRNNH